MYVRTLIVASLVLMAVSAQARSVEFLPFAHVDDCPPGAVYPVMQCQDHLTELPKVTLEFQDAGDGFWIAEYTAQGPGTWTSFNSMSFMLYPKNGVTQLMLQMNTGFDADPKRNPGTFFEAPPKELPTWLMVTGERRASPDGKFEVLAEFEFRDLKFRP